MSAVVLPDTKFRGLRRGWRVVGWGVVVAMCAGAVLLALLGGFPVRRAAAGVTPSKALPRDVAQWTRPDGSRVLIAVSSSRRSLRFYDFSNGRPLALAGENPAGAPRFDGILALACIDNLLFVAEPGHIQVLGLPDLTLRRDLAVPAIRHPDDLTVRRQQGGYRIVVGVRDSNGRWLEQSHKDWHPGLGAS